MSNLELEFQAVGVRMVSDCLQSNWALAITAILSILKTRGAGNLALIIKYSEMTSSPRSLRLIEPTGFTRGRGARPAFLNLSLNSSIVKSVLVVSEIPPLSLVCRALLDQNRDRSRSRNVDTREECFRLLNGGLPHNCATKVARGLVPPGMLIATLQHLLNSL